MIKFKSHEQHIKQAKVSGPLMSMEASGKFAGALVFANRLGSNVVRHLVTPSNPQSANQITARNIVRVTGAAQHFANLSTALGESRTITDKAGLILATLIGQTWNSTLVKAMIGTDQVNYDAGAAAWALLTAPQKTAWDNAAAALTPAFLGVAQKVAGGGPGTPLTAGNVFFQYQYGLYVLALASLPGAVPPVYA